MCFRVTVISEAPALLASPFYVQSMGTARPAIPGHRQPVPPHMPSRAVGRGAAPPTIPGHQQLSLPPAPLEPGCGTARPPSRGTSSLCLPACPLQGPQHTVRGLAGRRERGVAVSRNVPHRHMPTSANCIRLILVNKLGSQVTDQLQS